MPDARSLPPELAGLSISPSDWWIVLTSHLNVLVEGTEVGTEAVLAALTPRLRPPVRDWTGRPPDPPGGTLVVRALEKLDSNGQRALLDYLAVARAPRTVQVVSTSGQPVFPLIDRGLFLEELYYRLNTVRIDLDEKR